MMVTLAETSELRETATYAKVTSTTVWFSQHLSGIVFNQTLKQVIFRPKRCVYLQPRVEVTIMDM